MISVLDGVAEMIRMISPLGHTLSCALDFVFALQAEALSVKTLSVKTLSINAAAWVKKNLALHTRTWSVEKFTIPSLLLS
jgi:hypothetical protein